MKARSMIITPRISLYRTTMTPEVSEARARFPSGLLQPEASFRFSEDALHLANFALSSLRGDESLADLGAGCGVIGFALLLACPALRVIGVEKEQVLVDAARSNAERLALNSFRSLCGDVTCRETLLDARRMLADGPCPNGPPQFEAVVCNPPWRVAGTGHPSPSTLRRKALEAEQGFLPFLSAADTLLASQGSCFLALPADSLAEAIRKLPERLRPVRLKFVHSCRNGKPSAAGLALLEARKNSRSPLVVEEPLLLHARADAPQP